MWSRRTTGLSHHRSHWALVFSAFPFLMNSPARLKLELRCAASDHPFKRSVLIPTACLPASRNATKLRARRGAKRMKFLLRRGPAKSRSSQSTTLLARGSAHTFLNKTLEIGWQAMHSLPFCVVLKSGTNHAERWGAALSHSRIEEEHYLSFLIRSVS